MKLTSKMIKDFAKEIGLDAVGICPIERFEGAPPHMNPKNYFPGAKTVIVTLQRILRGSYRGIEEGTCWNNYTFYSYGRLNNYLRPRLTYRLASFIEDFGWEAVPHYPAVSERQPYHTPVEPGRLPADIVPSVRYLAVGAGLGEMGWSKVFLSKKFGPRCRMGTILTDAELEPDDIIEPGTICTKCGACARGCPGNAIPDVKSNETVSLRIGDTDVTFGDVQMGRCALTHHGMNSKASPFFKSAFPNFEFDVTKTNMTEVEGYKLVCALRNSEWAETPYNRSKYNIPQYPLVRNMSDGYFALCGAKGCIRECMNVLERTDNIENKFDTPFKHKKSWELGVERDRAKGIIDPWQEKYWHDKYPQEYPYDPDKKEE